MKVAPAIMMAAILLLTGGGLGLGQHRADFTIVDAAGTKSHF